MLSPFVKLTSPTEDPGDTQHHIDREFRYAEARGLGSSPNLQSFYRTRGPLQKSFPDTFIAASFQSSRNR